MAQLAMSKKIIFMKITKKNTSRAEMKDFSQLHKECFVVYLRAFETLKKIYKLQGFLQSEPKPEKRLVR